MPQPSLTVIIPCYNEAATIVPLLDEVVAAMQTLDRSTELIVVDDGSSDGTGERVAASAHPVTVIRHTANRGYGASLKSGIRAASGELVLVLDGDGQHDPADMHRLLAEAEGCDMVVGARQGRGSPVWRRPGKFLLHRLCEGLVGQHIPDINSGFRLFRKAEVMKVLHLCSDQFSFSTSSTLAFLCDRLAVRFVPITTRPRQGGHSEVRVATGFSTLMLILRIIGTFNPLPIFMPPTILLGALGVGLAAWGLIVERSVGDVAVVCLVTSAMLFCFGLLADQLALLRREINKS